MKRSFNLRPNGGIMKNFFAWFVIISLTMSIWTCMHSAEAGSTITAQDVISAEKVNKETRWIRKAAASVGVVLGGVSGYAAASAVAGATVPTVIIGTTVGAIYGGFYMYGAAALGNEWGIWKSADNIIQDLGTQLQYEGRKLQESSKK